MIKKKPMAAIAIAAVLLLAGCVSTDEDLATPQARFLTEGPVYISPAASPGTQDLFTAGISVTPGEDAVIREYTVQVEDDTGTEVYSFSGAAEDKTGLVVPDPVLWNGRDSRQNLVTEGNYLITVAVVDSKGRTAQTAPLSIVVDNTRPRVEVSVENNVFSPDGEGDRDRILIRQDGDDATTWLGRILNDEGSVVRSWVWEYDLPQEHEWDGRDMDDTIVDDGHYRYEIRGEDQAGNSVRAEQTNIRVDTSEYEVAVVPNRGTFSPNNNGRRDTVTFDLPVSDEREVIQYAFEITNEEEQVVVEQSDEGSFPTAIEFTGRSDGEALPEGEYRARVEVQFRNGETDEAISRSVTLDMTPPQVSVALDLEQFSPAGDEEHQTLTISQESESAVEWRGRIIPDGEDDSIIAWRWDDELPETVEWNGQTETGENAATGRYRYALVASDRAGNRTTVESQSFLLDRDAPEVRATIAPQPFNPDESGENELRIAVDASDRTGIDSWEITMYDPEGNEFARFDGDGEPPEAITWDGRSEDGSLPQSLRDYTAAVTVTNAVGNRSTTERTVSTGILVERDADDNVRFSITGVRFAPFEAEYRDLDDSEAVEQNRETLDRIAEYLKSFPEQKVLIEGHAVHIYYQEDRAQREHEDVLLPLSRERAEAVRDALVERGVDSERLATEGKGGSEPIVPHGDMENRWKNRRVEFVVVEE